MKGADGHQCEQSPGSAVAGRSDGQPNPVTFAQPGEGRQEDQRSKARTDDDPDDASLQVHSGSSTGAQPGDVQWDALCTDADTCAAPPSGGPVDLTRPSDEQILLYENELKEEQMQRPLLGGKEPLTNLLEEYRDGSPVFLSKIENLRKKYTSLRRTRQDGNCFYRAFLFGVLERILERRDMAAADKLKEHVKGWHQKLVEAGYQEIVFEDALQVFVDLLDAVRSRTEALSVAELHLRLLDDAMANVLIMLVRMITSAEVQRRSEHFAPFILGMTEAFMEVPDFCRRYIESMGEESDHLQLVAAADAFQIPIKVVYLDNSTPPGEKLERLQCDEHDFLPCDTAPGGLDPKVTVFYRPGHYDVLY